jgi:tetratricopeptide (TPR) repeat protein
LESRLGNIEQARQHYDAALPLYEAEQARLGKANTLQSLGDLESRLGNIEQARGHYDAALPLYEAEQDPTGKMNTWISLARLEAGLGRLSEADRHYQQAFHMADQIGFADHPVVQDWRQEHARLATASVSGQAAAPALAALLQVDSMESLQTTLTEHPILLELPTLEELAVLVTGAQETGQPEAARHLLALLATLLGQYGHTHTEQVDLAQQARFVVIHETLLPLAETLGDELAASLRRSLAWALNTLGNAHAEGGDHAAAVEAYTSAIAYAQDEAMLYRNRAGEHIEMEQWAQAEADTKQAAALEPDAPRLVDLRQALAQH